MVSRIEKIEHGVVVQTVERARGGTFPGMYVCLEDGSNKAQVAFATLDDVADFLRKHAGSGVRMNPGWAKVVDHIHIDGVAR